MKSKIIILKGFLLSFILILQISVNSGFSIQDKIYAPEDLPMPAFNKTDFIVDPDNHIVEEWKTAMLELRETYFFSIYVEPICVRVDHIRSPDDVDKYADKLVELWNLENRTNGRFVFQFSSADDKKIVYRFGSRVKEFFNSKFLNKLTKDIEEVHFEGTATGTGDYVSLGALGEQIFHQLAFDSEILTYEKNNGIHTFYPSDLERSYGEIQTMKKSLYKEHKEMDAIMYSAFEDELKYLPKNYFNELSQYEINQNFATFKKAGYFDDVQTVPNAREQDGGHVTDPHHLLNQFAIGMINDLLKNLEDSLGYQVAVVCTNSISDNDPHSWGTDLFNHWGIGEKETENGLLMLLVYDQHAVEFITGRGTEGVLTDVDCYNIQQQEMVPYFKKDDYVTGMIRGTQAVCDFFYGTPPLYSTSTDPVDASGDYYEYPPEENYNFFKSDIFGIYVMCAGILSAAWIIMLFVSLFTRDLHKRYFLMKFFTLTVWLFTFPIPFLLIYFLTKTLMERWRNTTRFSEKTGEEMHKLDDNSEDKHLAKGQISEEKVKSIDYDVWVTTGATDILILGYKKWFSKYNKCISCKYKTYFQVYDKTITAATYVSSGTGERMHRCENCGHSQTTTYTIPRKTRSSSGSGGSSSSGGSSFSGGGGSSYGGGSSRGGGAGSRW